MEEKKAMTPGAALVHLLCAVGYGLIAHDIGKLIDWGNLHGTSLNLLFATTLIWVGCANNVLSVVLYKR